MATTTIINKTRDLLEDNYKNFNDIQQYLTSNIFTLVFPNIDSTTLLVYKNGTLWNSSNYSYDSATGQITATGSLTAGDSLRFNYNYYQKYSDNEIRGYMRSAIIMLSTENYRTFTLKSDDVVFPTPTEREENLIALIARILANGDISMYRTPEIQIQFEKDVPQALKIKRAINQFKKTFGVIKFIKTDRDVKIDKEDE